MSDEPMSSTEEGPSPHPSDKRSALDYFLDEFTFFRVHLFAFIIVPLIFSAIFFASNGRFRVGFVDSLFLCYSAMTVTGLSTVDLSSLTAWQQVILYLLMMLGDITVVSWLMVLVRKHFFRTTCEYIAIQRRPHMPRSRTSILKSISSPISASKPRDEAPVRETSQPKFALSGPTADDKLANGNGTADHNESDKTDCEPVEPMLDNTRGFSSSPSQDPISLSPIESRRPPTVVFALSSSISRPDAEYRKASSIRNGIRYGRRQATIIANEDEIERTFPFPKSSAKRYRGFGGFPGPLEILRRFLKRIHPHAYSRLYRSTTVEVPNTQLGENTPWLNFDLPVGRNSDFHTESLTDRQLEEIGGTEYRALRLLSYLVPAYFVGTQLFSFILFAPWLSVTEKYDGVFESQLRIVQKPWFSLFQVMGAYTGGGLSLVDTGMVPFQSAYLMIFGLMFSILAGNHALPIFLRLIIWIGSKIYEDETEKGQVLSFLLQHPRRCYLYLFPSHQTWFLVICLLGFSAIEWFCFEVLNIGLQAFESIPSGPRIVAGLFQGLAARASGFSIAPISALAPALQFLYVVMMYIAVYPVAMSIRATNVYEERSLGVFEAPPEDADDEPDGDDLDKLKTRRERVGRYLSWHLRRQLSIDIWWIVGGVFLIAIVERNNLLDEEKKWFDLFRVLFELVSAFAGIGLSLGVPYDNFSFAGSMRPLSKLIIIVVMVRGRHRGLPVAVDRAILLPNELVVKNQDDKQPENTTSNA